MKRILSVLSLPLLVSCSHAMTHGTVAMMESDQLAHVSIHGVQAGQKVTLFHNHCIKEGDRGGSSCTREVLANGVVAKVFNEHYSQVEFPKGTKVKEGDFVEAE